MMLPVQSQGVTRSEGTGLPRDLNQILQPNVEQSARVVNVRQDPVSPTLFRISLEIGNHRLDVMTNRPLAEGLSVLLSRDARGEVVMRLPVPVNTATRSAESQALSALATQSGQFIATIAPESRVQAQQLLTQSQMSALVQPQIRSSATAQSAAGNNTSAAPPATNPSNPTGTTAPAATISGSATHNPTTMVPATSAQPASAAALNTQTSITGSPNAATITGSPTPAATASAASAPSSSTTPASAQTPTVASGSDRAALTPSNLLSPGAPSATRSDPGSAPVNSGTQTTQPVSNAATAAATSAQAQQSNQTNTATLAANTRTDSNAGKTSVAGQQTQPAAATTTQTGFQLARVVQSIQPSFTPAPVSQATINLGGETLNIISPRPLAPGQMIEVTRLSDSTLAIKMIAPQPMRSVEPAVAEEMQSLLRQTLPLQAPLADSLNQLRSMTQGKPQDAVGQIVRSLMSLFSLTPQAQPESQAKQVEQMVQQSGLFTENRLARQASGQLTSADDLRTRLGQLRKASKDLPVQVRDQLLSLIDKAEARATQQQIQSARQWRDHPDGSAERYFRTDLPLHTPEGFKQVELELREQRRSTTPGEIQTNWTLNLHFDLDPLGPVDARIHLEDEWEMSVAFWAESMRTTELIRERIEGFSNHLSQQGFKIDTINVRKGRAPNDLAPVLTKHLVDLHT